MIKKIENAMWNGKPAEARCVRMIVGKSPRSTWWCANIEGQEIDAVEVKYSGQTFYLENRTGEGLTKVTKGRGLPSWPHSSIPFGGLVT